MELYPLKVFLAVATEKSFSRAAEKLLRTQPAISLAVQRLESGTGREADRPVEHAADPDRRRPNRARIRAALREPGSGDAELAWPSCATTPPAG